MPPEQSHETAILEGAISVLAAIEAGNRAIHTLYVEAEARNGARSRNRQTARVERIARLSGIHVKQVSAEAIHELTNGQSHGGITAMVGPRKFVTIAELVTQCDCPFIAMLDGIEDPFNFGQAVRALYAAGADGLVVRSRNWTSAAGIVARASAGAAERMPMALTDTIENAANALRAEGLTIACTAKQKAVSLYTTDLAIPLFLIIGGERRGIARSFLDQADILLEIPYGRAFAQSLGAAAATSVLAFEVMRQRRRSPDDSHKT